MAPRRAGRRAASMSNIGRFQVFADSPHKLFRAGGQASSSVRSSSTCSAPLKIDFTTRGVRVTRHGAGSGDVSRAAASLAFTTPSVSAVPSAYEDALTFLAGWQGFVGRNADLFSLVGRASDLDHAKAQHKIAVIMGAAERRALPRRDGREAFYQLGQRCAQLTYNCAEPPRLGQHRSGRWRRQRFRHRDHQGDERGRDADRRLPLRRSHHARRHRVVAEADRHHAFELSRAQQPSAAQDRRGDP